MQVVPKTCGYLKGVLGCMVNCFDLDAQAFGCYRRYTPWSGPTLLPLLSPASSAGLLCMLFLALQFSSFVPFGNETINVRIQPDVVQ